MILQVGGFAVGAISIKSRSRSSASRKASGTGNTPNILPSSSITRTSGARISRFTLRPSLPSRFGLLGLSCPRPPPPPPLNPPGLPPPPKPPGLLPPPPPNPPLGRLAGALPGAGAGPGRECPLGAGVGPPVVGPPGRDTTGPGPLPGGRPLLF